MVMKIIKYKTGNIKNDGMSSITFFWISSSLSQLLTEYVLDLFNGKHFFLLRCCKVLRILHGVTYRG